MPKLLKFSLLLFFVNTSFAQISIRFYNYRPTGEFGFVMKPAFSGEIGYLPSFGDNDGRFRFRASATFLVMKPRLESFPIYGNLYNGSKDQVLPGTQSYKKYNIGQLFGGFDLAFIKKEPFYMYAGLDLTIGAANVDYTYSVQGIKTESYSGGGYLGGLRLRLGAEYDVTEDISIFINAQRSVWIISEPTALNWSNDYGLGMKYNFD